MLPKSVALVAGQQIGEMMSHQDTCRQLLTKQDTKGHMSSNLSFIKKCEFCGVEFQAKTLYTRYCSHTCNRKHYKVLKRVEKIQSFQDHKDQEDREPQSFDTTIQQKEFLSIEETSLLLGASRRTIQRLISKGTLKVGKIGRRTIVRRKEIDKLFT